MKVFELLGIDPQRIESLRHCADDPREQFFTSDVLTVLEKLEEDAPVQNPAGKVAGYTPQPDAKVALVNEFKLDEERLLRKLDALTHLKVGPEIEVGEFRSPGDPRNALLADQRWLAIARTHFQEGFMALNRAVFQPTRIKLPEDEA